MSQRIKESFDAYLSRIGLADAGPVQRRELRRAFYAGCWEVLCAVKAVDSESVSEDEGVAILQAMIDECEEFAGRMIEGRDWN